MEESTPGSFGMLLIPTSPIKNVVHNDILQKKISYFGGISVI